MFWRKKQEVEEEPGLDDDFMREEPAMSKMTESFDREKFSSLTSQPSIREKPSGDLEKDVQLILAKLDAIQALLDNLNQRVKNLERIAESE